MAALCVATCRVAGQESAEAIVGTGSRPRLGGWKRASRIEKRGWTHPAEGPNKEKGRCPNVLLYCDEPDRGAAAGRGIGQPNPNSLPGYGPVISLNRPVRTRTPGGAGRAGEKPALTRLGIRGELLWLGGRKQYAFRRKK